ncbi:MAG: hypothetical protein C4519_13885 [Desulfobacteraceae bacterium]|nr:MAG: hypothetical protein C4519_13885 [Desulfobacteraceae bacterium]
MLTEIIFKNYRCFKSHTLPFKEETIIVGRNNAGKSTVIEGIRIISIITERYKNLPFCNVPDWLDIPTGEKGVRVDLTGLGLSWENLFNHYGGPPASISAKFSNGTSIATYLGPEGKMHGVVRDARRKIVKSKGEARMIHLPRNVSMKMRHGFRQIKL